MFKYILALIPFIIVSMASAQQASTNSRSISGQVAYSSRINLNSLRLYNDTLKFNRNESMFRWYSKIRANQTRGKKKQKHTTAKTFSFSLGPKDTIGRINLYKPAVDSLYSRKIMVSKIYLIKESPDIHWTISDSTKEIGNFNCIMATTHFRGRKYIVWFTPQIPVPYGPWKLVGLPGLILQARDSTSNIVFRVQKVSFEPVGRLGSMPLSGKEKVIDLAQYKNIMTHLKKRKKKLMMKGLQNGFHARNGKVIKIARPSQAKIKIPEPKTMEIFKKKKD